MTFQLIYYTTWPTSNIPTNIYVSWVVARRWIRQLWIVRKSRSNTLLTCTLSIMPYAKCLWKVSDKVIFDSASYYIYFISLYRYILFNFVSIRFMLYDGTVSEYCSRMISTHCSDDGVVGKTSYASYRIINRMHMKDWCLTLHTGTFICYSIY